MRGFEAEAFSGSMVEAVHGIGDGLCGLERNVGYQGITPDVLGLPLAG
jgi:hypothetical protein